MAAQLIILIFFSDLNKFKYQLEKNWRSTEETYKKIIKDITGDDRYKNKNNKKYEDKHKQRKEQKHFSETKKNVEYKYKNSQNDDDHYKNQKSQNDNRKDYHTKNHKYHNDDDHHYKDKRYQNGEDDYYKNNQNDNRKEGKHIKEPSKIKRKHQNEEYMRKNEKHLNTKYSSEENGKSQRQKYD